MDFYSRFYNPITKDIEIPLIITISRSSSDQFVTYRLNDTSTALDNLAYRYYDDESMYRFILMANPQFRYENDIPNGTTLRIPFPKSRVIQEINQKYDEYITAGV